MHQLLTLNIPEVPRPLLINVFSSGDNHVSKTLREQGIWEAFETKLFVACASNSNWVLDIGANIGYYSILAGECIGETGKVLAFEPSPDNFSLLESNVRANQQTNIVAYAAALSNIDEDGFLYLSTDNFGDHQIYDNSEERKKTAIKLMKGDSCIKRHTNKADLIKIDTQGAEWHVLQGIQKTIANSLPNLQMIVEFSPNSLRLAGSEPDDLLDYIFGLDLPIALIDHQQHQLVPTTQAEMQLWSDATKPNIDDLGFFNLFIGNPPSI